MLLLWEHPLSPYAQKVKLALREKNVAFQARIPHGVGVGATEDGFAAVSPRREVPALIDGDAVIFDSRIIIDYIEDRHPSPPLLAREPVRRARARMVEEAVDTQLEAINWGLTELAVFKRASADLRARMEARARAQISGLHAFLARELGGQAYFAGEFFGRPDMAAISHLTGPARPHEGPLADWLARCLQRDSVRQTLAEAEGARASLAMAEHAVRSGSFKRQYRDHRLEWMMRSGGVDIVLEGLARQTIRFSTEFS
jgi:glutathione S-transferase